MDKQAWGHECVLHQVSETFPVNDDKKKYPYTDAERARILHGTVLVK